MGFFGALHAEWVFCPRIIVFAPAADLFRGLTTCHAGRALGGCWRDIRHIGAILRAGFAGGKACKQNYSDGLQGAFKEVLH